MPRSRIRKTADPLSIRILDSLTAEWQSYPEFIRKMAEFVPGEVAYRMAEKQRSYTTDKPRRHGDFTTVILSGSRTYVQRILRELRTNGRIEVEYDNLPHVEGEPVKVRPGQRPSRLRLSASEVELRASLKEKEKNASASKRSRRR